MTKPIDAAYRSMVKASTLEGGLGSGKGKTVTRAEMGAIKAVLEAKPGGITAADRVKVFRDLRYAAFESAARKIYNEILGFTPPVRPGPIALYGVAINNAVKSGDEAQLKIMQQLGLEAVKTAKTPTIKKAGGVALMAAMGTGGGGAQVSAAKIAEIQSALANVSKALKAL